MKVIALITLITIYFNVILARQLNVDPTSNVISAPCGVEASCGNLAAALESAQPGDIIRLSAGVFSGPLNVNLVVNIAGLQIVGVAQATILDLGLNAHAFLVLQPNVGFENLIIKNGISLDVSLAGAITVRLDVPSLGNAFSFQNVLFQNILGGALLINCGGTSTPSTPPSNPATPPSTTPSTGSSETSTSASAPLTSVGLGITVQAQLRGVIFVHIAARPALIVTGNVQIFLDNCQFQHNGQGSLNDTDNNTTTNTGTTGGSASGNNNIDGASIHAVADVLGLKVSVSLKDCTFLNNKGLSIIRIGSTVSGGELLFIGVNTFNGNVATSAVISTNPGLSLVICLSCQIIWLNNLTPLLCSVSCGLLGISLLCPGSCPTTGLLGGVLGSIL